MFKEASKQSTNIETNYKLTSLRCLSDVLQYCASSSLDSDFDTYWSTFVEKYFEQDFTSLKEFEELKSQQQQQQQINSTTEEQQQAVVVADDDKPVEEIKKLKLSETKDIDEAEQELADNFKFTILATIGKCMPYTPEIQG